VTPPLEPIPESVEALDELDPSADTDDLLARLRQLANRAQDLLPDLVGVSVACFNHGLTFTLVATDDEVAVLDAIQYAAGGPCVDAAHDKQVREFNNDDVLSETRWQMFAEATAARAIRSTLTLPLVGPDGGAIGTVNLYAASPRAFVGHHDQLADLFGAWAAGAVANADLSFMTRHTAQEAPGRVREAVIIDTAVGILAANQSVEIETAERRLRTAAQLAGVSVVELAADIVSSNRRQKPNEDPEG
jgi:GAF domain-containing protein